MYSYDRLNLTLLKNDFYTYFNETSLRYYYYKIVIIKLNIIKLCRYTLDQ